jgi:SAM-dependent methyltransferase
MNDTLSDPGIYEQNLAFWDKAWKMVKTPYTQMPPLPYLEQIPKSIEGARGKKVLDLGCGSGWLSVFLARQGFDVIGVDVAENALKLGQMWAEQENLSIKFITKDISDLDFPDNYFAAVVANSIFEHLPASLARKTVELLSKAVEKGGVFFGCFDKVGTGPGEYYKLDDGTHVYTDKGRQGMMLRCFSDEEIRELFSDWTIEEFTTIESGSRLLIARR